MPRSTHAFGDPGIRYFGLRVQPELRSSEGSTGDPPVPSGDPPLGTGSAHELFPAPLANGGVPVIPSGQWPDGTGW